MACAHSHLCVASISLGRAYRQCHCICIRICIHVCNAHGKISYPISLSAEPSIANLHSVNCASLRNSSRQSTTARCECPDAEASPASRSVHWLHARGGGLYFACKRESSSFTSSYPLQPNVTLTAAAILWQRRPLSAAHEALPARMWVSQAELRECLRFLRRL